MDSLISIIVPVYKVEQYLDKCLTSIINQTYKNIEIIIVDDGSPDSCPKICDEFARRDNRVKVVHKSNGGLSDARNVGIDIAMGDYYCFVDGDDYIESTMIEHLYDAMNKTGTKLAISNFKTIDEEGNRIFSSDISPIKNCCLDAYTLLPKLYQELGWYFIVAWNKLYHKSLFENVRFPVKKIHEDEYVVTQIICNAGKIACIDSEEYNYLYLRKGSIMSKRNIQSQIDWLEALYIRFNYCKTIKGLEEFANQTRAVYFRELCNFRQMNSYKSVDKKEIIKLYKYYGSMKNKTLNEKINWLLFILNPKLQNVIMQRVRLYRGKK